MALFFIPPIDCDKTGCHNPFDGGVIAHFTDTLYGVMEDLSEKPLRKETAVLESGKLCMPGYLNRRCQTIALTTNIKTPTVRLNGWGHIADFVLWFGWLYHLLVGMP